MLIVERLFKLGEHWQLDHRLEALFRRITHFSMLRTMGMTAIAMAVTFLLLQALKGLLFNVPTLVVWILLGVLCIGAGKVRVHYHAWLKAASRNDPHPCEAMASELTLIHGVPPDCNEREFLRELQNALLWINFRFYLAPLFWFIVGGPWGPVTLVGYAFLRAWQTWLARYQTPYQRLQSGIDAILHVLDWIPVRLAGVVYALLGHGSLSVAGLVCLAGGSAYFAVFRCSHVWRSSHWRANRILTKWKPLKRRCRWRRRPRLVVVVDYCVAHHLWGISVTLCRWR